MVKKKITNERAEIGSGTKHDKHAPKTKEQIKPDHSAEEVEPESEETESEETEFAC